MLLQLTDVNKIYNGAPLLKHISLTIEDRDRIGLIGVNGCGKSTLLKLITERILPDHIQEGDGEIIKSSHTSIGYLEQMGGLEKEQTVWHEMHNVFQPLLDAQARMRELEQELADNSEAAAEEYHRLQTYFESNDGYQIDVKIKMVLNGMGFGAETYERKISSFSGGEKTRLAIAKLLLEEPTLLILDEPTNHLDFKTVMWLEDYLKDYKGALLLVSHDRYFLNRLCTSICEIEHGVLTRYKGDYSAYTVQKEAAVIRQTKEYELQQKEIAKLEDYIARNQTRASTAKSAQSRMKQLEKMEREKPITYQKSARVQFTYDIEPPQQVLQVQDIAIAVGSGAERKVLAEPVSFEVRRGEKWGIIGENGVGKSTLLKILQGQLPHIGKIRWAAQTKISYFEQESTNLHPAKTVMQEIHDRVPTWLDYDVRSLLGKVRITGEEVYKQVGVLSGGERAKVCFAVMMLEHGNILILDEPTNHLDISMKEVIEDAMKTFTGTILFVSHDRYLLDQVADHILEIKPTGVKTYIGGFQSWLDATKKEAAAANAAAQAVETEKKKEDKQQTYRSKEQRAKAAQQRARMRQLEQQSEAMQAELDALNEEITKEEVYSDFNLMQEKCKRMDTLRTELDAALEEMILLEEELG